MKKITGGFIFVIRLLLFIRLSSEQTPPSSPPPSLDDAWFEKTAKDIRATYKDDEHWDEFLNSITPIIWKLDCKSRSILRKTYETVNNEDLMQKLSDSITYTRGHDDVGKALLIMSMNCDGIDEFYSTLLWLTIVDSLYDYNSVVLFEVLFKMSWKPDQWNNVLALCDQKFGDKENHCRDELLKIYEDSDDTFSILEEILNKKKRDLKLVKDSGKAEQIAKEIFAERKDWEDCRQKLDGALMMNSIEQVKEILRIYHEKLDDGKKLITLIGEKMDERKADKYITMVNVAMDEIDYHCTTINRSFYKKDGEKGEMYNFDSVVVGRIIFQYLSENKLLEFEKTYNSKFPTTPLRDLVNNILIPNNNKFIIQFFPPPSTSK